MIQQVGTLCRLVQHGIAIKRPSYLLYLVTMRCNGRCKMCLYWRDQNTSRHELTVDEVDRFTRSIGRLFQVQFSGGEPFLRDDFGEIVLRVAYNCQPCIITIPTNASMPEVIVPAVETFCRKLPNTMLRMDISIDGVGEEHDAIRGVPGFFDRAMATFEGLRALSARYSNVTTNVISVLSYFNRDTIIKTIRYVRETIRPDYHGVMLTRADPRDQRASEVTIEEYEDAVKELRRIPNDGTRRYPLGKLATVLASELAALVAATYRERRQVIPCIAGQKQILVDDEGAVYPCEVLSSFLTRHPTSDLKSAEMGRLREFDYSVPDVLRSPQATAVRRFIAAGRCYCTSECFLPSSMLFNPAMYPRLAWASLRQLLSRPNSG